MSDFYIPAAYTRATRHADRLAARLGEMVESVDSLTDAQLATIPQDLKFYLRPFGCVIDKDTQRYMMKANTAVSDARFDLEAGELGGVREHLIEAQRQLEQVAGHVYDMFREIAERSHSRSN